MFRFVIITALTASLLFADTFTHSETGKVYNGFATQPDENDKTWIVPEGGEKFEADLSEYKIEPNQKGRKNEIAVLEITYPIVSAMKTEAFEEAIVEESNKGPSAIIVEVDTPGGRVDLAKRICSSIMKTSNCTTAAYIAGGQHGGAYSAGAAISMACDKIYMAPGTVIGAATAIIKSRRGASDMDNAFGETVGEKFNSAWRNYMASIAEQSGRSAALAKAMVEKDTSVLEVSRDGKKLFIEPGRKIEGDEVKGVVVQKGSLLTLTAKKAKKCDMADEICESRDYAVSELSDSKPEVVVSDKIKDAEEKLDKVTRRFKGLKAKIEREIVQINARYEQNRLRRRDALKSLRSLSRNSEFLLNLKKRFPDVPVSVEEIERLKNDVDGMKAAME
ncbi:hypothetical protein [Sedimentisphaera salicampi]|uniref:Signal peptide peptidase SppA, 36K type n=1 Tax=Sedimentisphaera salicampi TaxID=1941349 RepID=A0A1W6LMF1_9BACT|nr:hypothetical protein [Sedimentisphaera salicampi]ARN56968.1 signal peptide peptidase SppA, 36K type [Sedimentisphaera salicampi]